MLYAPVDLPISDAVQAFTVTESPPYLSAALLYFSGEYPMDEIVVGRTRYKFRNIVRGCLYPTDVGDFEFVLDSLASYVVGRGQSREDAERDWREQVHTLFQRLLKMRPWEMSADEAACWRSLNTLIDVAEYRRTTPIAMRQLGRIRYLTAARPQRIDWAAGGIDHLAFDEAPPEIAGYRAGQWIEAVVDRDPVSGKLLRIHSVEPIPEIRPMGTDEQSRYLEGLPTFRLPESDVDWTASP